LISPTSLGATDWGFVSIGERLGMVNGSLIVDAKPPWNADVEPLELAHPNQSS
jgi:hypothetical protein